MKKEFLDTFYNKFQNEKGKSEIPIITIPMSIIINTMHLSEKYIYETHDITRSEMDILATLYLYNDALTAAEVSERLVFTSGGISKVVKKLEMKKLIYKKVSVEDKRSLLLYISDKGKIIMQDCIPKLDKVNNKFFEVLNDNEKKVLEQAFKKIMYAISN